jgi:hypothetical protein
MRPWQLFLFLVLVVAGGFGGWLIASFFKGRNGD